MSMLTAVALIAGSAGWQEKAIPEWTEQDARELLVSSPWAKSVQAAVLPELTPEQRRAGGVTGGGKGSGLRGLTGDLLGGIRETDSHQAQRMSAAAETVLLRWESALPVRVAELKAREIAAPDWEGDYYVLSVRNVNAQLDELRSEAVLKHAAELQIASRKALKPVRVKSFPQASGQTTILYLFPRSAAITAEDGQALFTAQIGRAYISQTFQITEMTFQHKLEL